MEEDFILPEREKAVTSNKTFLLTAVTLLSTLIVLSLGVIALFLLNRQDKLDAILAPPTLAATVYQDIVLTASFTATVTRTAILAFSAAATITEG